MDRRDDSLKDALLSELPRPEDLAQYRIRVDAMLVENQKAFQRERRVIQVGWIVCVAIAIGFLWFDGGPSTTPKGPWLAWGPYLWTDGLAGRRDGLQWTCNDVEDDGTHPSKDGVQKVVTMLTTFFKTDPTAKRWYVARPPRVRP